MAEVEMNTGYQGVPLTNEPERCAQCGDEEADMKDTHMGLLCSSCTRKCAICGDWMLDEEGIVDNKGNEAHKECANESLEYEEYRREKAEDAVWDHKISEWKDGDRAINGRYRGER